MSYRDPRERVSPSHSSTASQKSSSSDYVTPTREQERWKSINGGWRGGNNWKSQPFFGPRYEFGGTGGYRGPSSFIGPSYEPCNNCGDGAHPRWKCLFYGRICPRCFKLGHSPDYCRLPAPLAGVSFYHDACYFSAETIVKLASLDFDTRREEIKCMYNVLSQDEVSVISLAMEMHESDDSRRARCFRCHDFHSSQICWYSGRQCGLCGRQGHAEVVCSLMALSRKNCEYHHVDPPFYGDGGKISLLPQGGEVSYTPQLDFYNGEMANVMETRDLPSRLTKIVDTAEAAESNLADSDPAGTSCADPDPTSRADLDPAHTSWADSDPAGTSCADSDPAGTSFADPDPTSRADLDPAHTSWADPDPVHTSWADPDPVHTSWADSDPVHTSWADSDPVYTSWADPDPVHTSWADPVHTSWADPDPVKSSCEVPDPVESSCDVLDPVDSGCATPDPGNDSCAVAAPADPNCSTGGSTSSNCAAGDPTIFNGDTNFTSVPTLAADKPKCQSENNVGPVNSNLDLSVGEPATSGGCSASKPVCFEPVNGQDTPKLNQSTADLKCSCSGEIANSSIDGTATSSDVLVSSSVPDENCLSPCAAETCAREKCSRAKGSTLSASSGSSSDEAYTTAEEYLCSSENSDTVKILSKTLISTTESGSESNGSNEQQCNDASRRSTRDSNSGSKEELKGDASDDLKNGLAYQRSATEQHQSVTVPSIHVTDAVDETAACSPSDRMVSESPVFSSTTNRKRKHLPTTVLPPCSRCLATNHLPENCWAKEMKCFTCLTKGHIARACSEPTTSSSRIPTKSRARDIDRVQKNRAVLRSNSGSDSALPPSPVMQASPAATSSMSPTPCSSCLATNHMPENCWAKEMKCFICLTKGHIAKACSEPTTSSLRTPTKSRARDIYRVRKNRAVLRSNSGSDSALPLSPVMLASTRDQPSPAATSSMSPTEKIFSDTPPKDGTYNSNSRNGRKSAQRCHRCLATNHLPENCRAKTSTCFRCQTKGHIERACTELRLSSSSTPTTNSPSRRSRARGIDRVRNEEAACCSSSDSDSALPPSPVMLAPTREQSSLAATSSMSPTKKIDRNQRKRVEDASHLADNTSACSENNVFETQEPDQEEKRTPQKAAAIGPPSLQNMMAGNAPGGPRHKHPQHKQRRDDQLRHDRPPHQQYSSRGSPKKQNKKHSDLVAAASAAVAAAGSSVRQEPRGTPLASLTRMSAAHPGVPGVTPSRQHEVLVKLPAPQGRPPLPYPPPSAAEDIWDQYHVRMPCSASSLYASDSLPPGYPDTGPRNTVPRWSVISWALTKPLKNVDDVQRAIVSYNGRYQGKWLLHGLQAVVRQFSEEEEEQFFNNTLPGMCRLALRLPELVTRAPSLLVAHRCKAVTLSQLQIASLLANAFFCTFPRRNAKGSDTEYAHFPDINFSRLLNADGPSVLEKIKCLLNYFRVVSTTEPVGLVTFARHMVENAPAVVWQQCSSALPRLHCDDRGLIEEATGLLQVDFANRFLGGGVLGHGCVQEEIRFMLCPELLVTRLLAEALDKTEAIIVVGVEQYSRGDGYADSFVFAGRHEDITPRDSFGRRMCQLTAIDAVHFRAQPSVQFKEDLVVREINKAYAGFCALEGTVGDLPAVATGNWGCGAFRGNPLLKALLQLAACGYAGRDVAYFTFLDPKIKNRIADMHEFLVKGGVTVGALVQCICQYGALSREGDGSDLYQYLYHNLRDPSRTPSPGDSPRPADKLPQLTANTSERTSGSSWAAKSREMNGNSFNGTNRKVEAQNKARGQEIVVNNARMTDFFPRLPEKGSRGDDKNGTDSIASVHQPPSSSCQLSQSSGGFWDVWSPGQGAPTKGTGGRGGGRHKRNRGRDKEGMTNQQIVDALTAPDPIQEENSDLRGEENGSGAGEFTSSAAKRGRKKKNKSNRRNAHNIKDGNALSSPFRGNKGATSLDRNMPTGHDDPGLTGKKSVGCS